MKNFFVPGMILSASVHGFLIGAGGLVPLTPQASVLQAPSSLEITFVQHPLVSVVDRKIVPEKMIESPSSEEVVFRHRLSEPARENAPALSLVSRESRGAVTKAEPLTGGNPAPPYPLEARQEGWEGLVRLEVLVGKDGLVQSAGVDESSGYGVLDNAALETVRTWEFSPARSGPVPFASRIIIPVRFTLLRE